MTRPDARYLLAALLALGPVAATLPGCEAGAFLADAATGGSDVPAAYPLKDRPTLILIDDPNTMLGGPILAGVVAANAGHHLREEGVVNSRIVPDRELSEFAAKLGREYARTPIDEIGRRLGAEQVIYASVESVVVRPGPGLYRPSAILQVKVIDARTGERLFPAAPPIDEPNAPKRGRTLAVEMKPEGINVESPGADVMMARKLAERIGLRLAQLFYDHEPDHAFVEPG